MAELKEIDKGLKLADTRQNANAMQPSHILGFDLVWLSLSMKREGRNKKKIK